MSAPRPLHDRAIENLRFIRDTMERASAFTAVPGWGQVAIGVTALAAAAVAARQPSSLAWLATWLGECFVALGLGGWAMVRKARAAHDPILGSELVHGATLSGPGAVPDGSAQAIGGKQDFCFRRGAVAPWKNRRFR